MSGALLAGSVRVSTGFDNECRGSTDVTDSDSHDCGMAVITEAVLSNQPKGLVLEYRIFAVNFAGESSPSNVVSLTM